MKKLIYLAMAFGLVACQAEKVDVNGGLEGETDANFLAINIVAANATTRAGGGNADEEDNYEDGWKNGDDESTVNSIRFYFFYDGAPTPVDLVTGYSYRDFEVDKDGFGSNNEQDLPNVEHKLNATVLIHRIYQAGGSPSGLPNQVVAIVNPTDAIKEALGNTPALSKVQKSVLGTLAYEDNTDGKSFVMTNSVYVNKVGENATTFDAVKLVEDNFKHTQQEATNAENSVKIYVERVVAKLELTIENTPESNAKDSDYWGGNKSQPKMQLVDLNDGTKGYNTYVKYKVYTDGKEEEKEAYVKLLGWNVTATANKSFLVKNINPKWPGAVDDILDGSKNLFKTTNEPWNYAGFYRSYWAYNPDDVQLEYGTFNESVNESPEHSGMLKDENPAFANKFGTKNICYLPENAGAGESLADAANASPSQVIIGAQLVDKDGNALKLAEFMGSKFVYDDTYTNVKQAILNALLNTNKYYKIDNGKYVSMSPEDIEIKSALELKGNELLDVEKTGRYFVYAQLKDDQTQWYIYEGNVFPIPEDPSGNMTEIANEKIDEALMKLPAKIWESGNTYYFLNIRHLADPTIDGKAPNATDYDVTEAAKVPGFYGVVRNHVYQTRITGIFGLGTPVFDPDEIIIPEKPEEEEVYLAAEINILSWRIVDHGYDLNW